MVLPAQGKKSSVMRWVRLYKATAESRQVLDALQLLPRLPSSYILDNPFFQGDKSQRLAPDFAQQASCSKVPSVVL